MALLKAVSEFVVFGSDGSVDVDATTDNLRAAIASELERNAVRDSEIETALDDVFARLGTDIYPTPEVVSIASALMVGSDLTKMASTADEVRDYLSRSSRFVGERGRKGGLRKVK